MYEIKKIGAMFQVLCISSGRIQFSSLKRRNCADWINFNTKKEVQP